MSQIAVFSSDAHLEEMLRSTGLRATRIAAAQLAEYARGGSAPAALVIDVRGQHQLPTGLSAFRKQHPASGVVLVTSTLDPRLMLEAMRAGVNECVQEPLTNETLEQAVRRVIVDGPPEAAGQLFAFVGSKGGVGTTTVAVNTAAALARGKGAVLLADLNLGHGDAPIFLGAEPRFSVVDALENVHKVDESFFRGLVDKKASVDVLGSSDRLPQMAVDSKRLMALLDFAVRKYRFTVLDVPRSDLAMLDALDPATTIVVVTTQELSALRNAGRLAQTLRVRYGASRVKALVNRFDHRAEIADGDIERVIGDPVKHLIPSDYRAAIEAVHAGQPLVLGSSRVGQALRAFAAELGGVVKEKREEPSGVLGRLVFRRA